jgi:hypothetical protein
MCNVYERYRLNGADADAFCFIDVKIQWNSDPSDIKISIRNNGIFYFTYDGSGTNLTNQTEEEELFYGPGVSLRTSRDESSTRFSTPAVKLYACCPQFPNLM